MGARQSEVKASATTPAILAYPMHGIDKFYLEGFRTRDAHLIEWMGRLLPEESSVGVVSRPEPFPRRHWRNARIKTSRNPRLHDLGSSTLAIPNPIRRQEWWVKSARKYPKNLPSLPTVSWNPFVAVHFELHECWPETFVMDLLDDWSVHAAFGSVRRDVERAYELTFARATSVFANSEGTLALAHRFGRDDAALLPNGVDPDRFSIHSSAVGPVTVGYVGKIGSRLDPALIEGVVSSHSDLRFVFAGPFMERSWRAFLGGLGPHVEVLGDVHYRDVPSLLQTFDIGWIPHRVGSGEVGGDAIKLYEYRAAGLPVLTTPIIGAAERPLESVQVLPADEHSRWLEGQARNGTRPKRIRQEMPAELTWQYKARQVIDALLS